MSFWTDYPNRKDKRRPKRAMASSCQNHGGCPWCEGNRLHADAKRRLSAEEQMDDAFDALYARTVAIISDEWGRWLEVEG